MADGDRLGQPGRPAGEQDERGVVGSAGRSRRRLRIGRLDVGHSEDRTVHGCGEPLDVRVAGHADPGTDQVDQLRELPVVR